VSFGVPGGPGCPDRSLEGAIADRSAAVVIQAPKSEFANRALRGMSIVCDLAAAAREGCRAKKGLKTLVKLRTRAHEALTNAKSGTGSGSGSGTGAGPNGHTANGQNGYAASGGDTKPPLEPIKVSSISHLIDPVEVPVMLPSLSNHNYPHAHQHSQNQAQNQHGRQDPNQGQTTDGEPYHTGFSDPMTFTPLPDFHLSPEDPLASPIDILGFNIDDFLTEMRDDNLLFLS